MRANSFCADRTNSGVLDAGDESFLVLPDLDSGLRWSEGQLLQSTGVLEKEKRRCLLDQLQELAGDNELASRTMGYLEKEELPAGEHLIQQGDSPGSIYFLEEGVVTAQLEMPGEVPRRLNTTSRENVVGELGFYLGAKRNASVVTESQATLYRLSIDALQEMESEDPETAALMHKYIALIMAEKLSYLMSTVESLRR